MRERLEGLSAVVTGAERGLGCSVADLFEREGASVFRCGSDGADFRNRDAVLELVERLASRLTKVHVLVNAAAVVPCTPLGEIPDAEWDETLGVNLTAPFLFIRGLLGPLRSGEGGSIINLSSPAGVHGLSNHASYCTSQFGVEGLTRALALELANEPMSVNSVTPGLEIQSGEDATRLGPAFLFLALARGRPTGMRFDALHLSLAVEHEGFSLDDYVLGELAE